MDTNIARAYPFGKLWAFFLHIFSKCTSFKLSQRTFFTPLPPPHIDTQTLNYGPATGASGKGGRPSLSDSRTVTADTFFAHLLTLRMFRVYVFICLFPKIRTHGGHYRTYCFWFFTIEVFPWTDIIFLYLDVLFFCMIFLVQIFCIVLTVTPAWIQGNVKRCYRALCLEKKKKITFTYFAFTTAKKQL